MNIFIKLYLEFFKIGLFSFGGGYAVLALIRQEIVANYGWLGAKEFADLVAISQATPGPVAINGATYVGYRMAGFWGSVTSTIGVITPSIAIMLMLTKFFFKFKDNRYMEDAFSGLRPATIGLIAAAAILLGMDSFVDYKSIIIFAAVFIASYRFKADPILMTILAGVAGLLLYR